MPEILGIPLHPAVVHFPIAGSLFAAGALAGAILSPPAKRGPWISGALFLLVIVVASSGVALWSGHEWAESLALSPGDGGWFPPASVRNGLLRQHVQAATAGAVMAFLALVVSALSLKGRLHPGAAAVICVLTAGAIGAAGHAGGMMVHGPKPPEAGAAQTGGEKGHEEGEGSRHHSR